MTRYILSTCEHASKDIERKENFSNGKMEVILGEGELRKILLY